MDKLSELNESVNSYELGGESYSSIKWLAILFNKFSKLEYSQGWIERELFTSIDVRPMVLLQIESATLWYEQNLISSRDLNQEFLSAAISHGYDTNFGTYQAYVLREVQNRVGFLDSVYFAIDHFITKMIAIHAIDSQGQNKVNQFLRLLEHFGLEKKGEKRKAIVCELRELVPCDMKKHGHLFAERGESEPKYLKTFEYLTLIRNCLHNNGFANKSMANLQVGPFEYLNIKKDGRIECMGLPNLILLVVQMVNIIEKLCLLSSAEIPQKQIDPYLQSLKDELGFYPGSSKPN